MVSAGFPCQDISAAGSGKGLDGERSGLWLEAKRIIREVGPAHVFLENSPILTSRGLGRVLGDLASMGFDAKWGVLGAADVGAPHIRDRIWIVAHANAQRLQERPLHARSESQARCPSEGEDAALDSRWPGEPDVVRVVHGMAGRVDRIKALGNGQVPRVAAAAWRLLA